MERAVTRIGSREVMPVSNIAASLALVHQVYKEVMKKDIHYGVIPGTTKPTLYKPGAQTLCLVFRLYPDYEITEINLDNDHKEYRVRCTLREIGTDLFVSTGYGSATTKESRYRWRNVAVDTGKPVPHGYWELKKAGKLQQAQDILGGKDFTIKKNDAAQWTIHSKGDRVENSDIADVYNTVLKVGCKRSYVEATLNATAASDMFEQDFEDLPDYLKTGESEPGYIDKDVDLDTLHKFDKEPYPADKGEFNPQLFREAFEKAIKNTGVKYGKMSRVYEFVAKQAEAFKMSAIELMKAAMQDMPKFMKAYSEWSGSGKEVLSEDNKKLDPRGEIPQHGHMIDPVSGATHSGIMTDAHASHLIDLCSSYDMNISTVISEMGLDGDVFMLPDRFYSDCVKKIHSLAETMGKKYIA